MVTTAVLSREVWSLVFDKVKSDTVSPTFSIEFKVVLPRR